MDRSQQSRKREKHWPLARPLLCPWWRFLLKWTATEILTVKCYRCRINHTSSADVEVVHVVMISVRCQTVQLQFLLQCLSCCCLRFTVLLFIMVESIHGRTGLRTLVCWNLRTNLLKFARFCMPHSETFWRLRQKERKLVVFWFAKMPL